MKWLVKLGIPALALSACAFAQAQTYRIFDLSPNTSFDETLAYGINKFGQATGTGYIASTGELHALVFTNGQVVDLGMLGYDYGADGVAINASGQLAATGYGPGYRALIYSNGSAHSLGSLDGGSSEGLSINSSGHIVGRAINGDGGGQGFIYTSGHMTALSVDRAACINDSDQYVGSVGYYWIQNNYMLGVEHAFLTTGGVLTDLGNLGGGLRTNSEAYGINNAGQVVGYSTTSTGYYHAFLYTGGALQDLGSLDAPQSKAFSINSRGQILGDLESTVGGVYGYFLYSGGVMRHFEDLLDSRSAAWTDLVLCNINDNGWIVGYGTVNGTTHGFIARPVPPKPVSIGAVPWP